MSNNESIGGSYVYDTYDEAQADLANIREGSTVYIKEGTESDIQEQIDDIESKLVEIITVDGDLKDLAVTNSENGMYYAGYGPSIPSGYKIISVVWGTNSFPIGVFFEILNNNAILVISNISRTFTTSKAIKMYCIKES